VTEEQAKVRAARGDRRAAVLAVDGGNSKAEIALVGADGQLLAARRGPTISHQAVGIEQGMANLRALAAAGAAEAGLGGGPAGREPLANVAEIADIGAFCLAGADYPSDVRLLRDAIEALGLAGETVIRNDTFAALRAGTHRPWGIALICGQGINGAGVAPDGRSARFDGLGAISGDWGGAGGLGTAALGAAVRARDGRGPRTSLEQLVPKHFEVRSTAALTRALYTGRISERRLAELSPVVFKAAEAGDAVARSIVDRLAAELVAMAGALIRRLRLGRLDPEVVLAGGVFRATDPVFYAAIETGIKAVAPHAQIVRLTAPPVLGAALIGLDRLSPGGATPPDVEARLRGALEAWRER
jgi:N-acetylglucosamine kinase-like BadF-type ATPase